MRRPPANTACIRSGRVRPGKRHRANTRLLELLEPRLLLTTLYVDLNSPGATHNGTSWATAYTNPQSALAAAVSGDQILVADGTYKPTATTSRTVSFQLKTGVSLIGGYAGFGAPDPGARDPALYPTILSGEIGSAASKADNSYHVVTAISTDSTALLDGFTITGGNANGTFPQNEGGGMYNSNATPTVQNCIFAANSAEEFGGGMANAHRAAIVSNCTFIGNTAHAGGGMANISDMVTSGLMTNCTFIGNSADTQGGGMYNFHYNGKFTNFNFLGNSVVSSVLEGGGMFNSSSTVVLTNFSFTNNAAASKGSALFNSSTKATLINCTIRGNSSGDNAISGASAIVTITNSVIWGSGTLTAGSASITYSDVQGGYAGTGNVNVDPQFVRTPWPGPDGVYATADDDYGDLHLRPGSPLLNSGSNLAIPPGVTTDLAGNPRIQNDFVDIGALEGSLSAPATKIIYVDINALGAANGTSWTNAFSSLQSALQAAADGDTIRVADGAYKPTATTDRSLSFALRHAVAIYGSYAGVGAPDPDARDLAATPTRLSGEIGLSSTTTDNSYHVLTAMSVATTSILDGVIVTGGNANATASSNSQGGGMLNLFASPSLINCTFTLNSAYYGGGIYNSSSNPVLVNCAINGNSAVNSVFSSPAGGGGIFNSSSNPKLTNCTFTANTVAGVNVGGSGGGAVYNAFSSPELVNCTFVSNIARMIGAGGGNGNAIYNVNNSLPRLANCIMWGNGTAPIFSGTAVITFSDIEGGYAGLGNLNINPQFVRSPWAGPDGLFGTLDDDFGDLRLRSGSLLINAGSNAAIPLGITTDISGTPRLQDGTVDLGAFEGALAGVSPKIIYVDINAAGNNSGVSWPNAFVNLQSALQIALDGDIIRIANGAYTPTSSSDRAISFSLRNAVTVYGGYAGYGAPNPDTRDPILFPSILSGNIGAASGTDNSFHVLTAACVGNSSILDGVTISGGNAGGAGLFSNGGGAFILGSSLLFNNCIFTSNVASNLGGGIYVDSCSPTFTNCSWNANSAILSTGAGGGLYNSYSNPVLNTCAFTANSAANGGGMHNLASSPSLLDCSFIANSVSVASGNGGGIYNDGEYSTPSSPFISNCVFTANTAGDGGGMFNSFAAPVLIGCSFNANGATSVNGFGGGVYSSAASSAGALTAPAFVNCTFVANFAPKGGAMYNTFVSTVVSNCTFASNSASSNGSVIYNTLASPTITNSILWNNGTASIFTASGAPVISFSDVQGGFAGTGNINLDPLFVRTPAAGDYGDLRLRLTSPAIDAGANNAPKLAGISTDRNGAPRFIDLPIISDTGLGTAPIIDMGAYEVATAFVFYNNSAFDAASDTAAIAIDKTPLLPGRTATFANYTSYSRGINGLIIDLPGLHAAISAADFTFALGNDNTPGTWPAAPAPLSLMAATGDTTSTWTRVTITWDDHALQGQWLQVALAANANSGLAAPLVFYFGNAPGDSGNSSADTKVNAADQIAPRLAASPSVPITSRSDYNRDGVVNRTDELIAAQNYTYFLNELRLISVPQTATLSAATPVVPALPLGPAVRTGLPQPVAMAVVPAQAEFSGLGVARTKLVVSEPRPMPLSLDASRPLLIQLRRKGGKNVSVAVLRAALPMLPPLSF